MAQQLLKSRPDHFTCSQEQLLIPVGESEDALQIFEIVPGYVVIWLRHRSRSPLVRPRSSDTSIEIGP
jgi:hypothetical protein